MSSTKTVLETCGSAACVRACDIIISNKGSLRLERLEISKEASILHFVHSFDSLRGRFDVVFDSFNSIPS